MSHSVHTRQLPHCQCQWLARAPVTQAPRLAVGKASGKEPREFPMASKARRSAGFL